MKNLIKWEKAVSVLLMLLLVGLVVAGMSILNSEIQTLKHQVQTLESILESARNETNYWSMQATLLQIDNNILNMTIEILEGELKLRFCNLTVILCYGKNVTNLEISNIALHDNTHGMILLDLKDLKIDFDPQHNETTLCSISIPIDMILNETGVQFDCTYPEAIPSQENSTNQEGMSIQGYDYVIINREETISVSEDTVWYVKFT